MCIILCACTPARVCENTGLVFFAESVLVLTKHYFLSFCSLEYQKRPESDSESDSDY